MPEIYDCFGSKRHVGVVTYQALAPEDDCAAMILPRHAGVGVDGDMTEAHPDHPVTNVSVVRSQFDLAFTLQQVRLVEEYRQVNCLPKGEIVEVEVQS